MPRTAEAGRRRGLGPPSAAAGGSGLGAPARPRGPAPVPHPRARVPAQPWRRRRRPGSGGPSPMAWRVRPSVGGRWVPQHAWAWACALPSTSSPPRCWAGRPPCARVGVRRATPCGSGGASAPAGAWGRWARADAAWQPTSRRPLALPLASACGAGCTPRKREGRRGSPPHGGRRCARDWSTRPTPSTAHAAPCRAGPSPGGASDGSHRPGAPVHLAPVSAPGPARRPVWGGSGRRARPDLGLDAQSANPHVGRLSGGASTSPPRNSGACENFNLCPPLNPMECGIYQTIFFLNAIDMSLQTLQRGNAPL